MTALVAHSASAVQGTEPTTPAASQPSNAWDAVAEGNNPSLTATAILDDARSKIQHVVVIIQENRSFDSYFGTCPGADGIPMRDGVPTVCVPDPQTNECVKPFHDPNNKNAGGPRIANLAIKSATHERIERGRKSG